MKTKPSISHPTRRTIRCLLSARAWLVFIICLWGIFFGWRILLGREFASIDAQVTVIEPLGHEVLGSSFGKHIRSYIAKHADKVIAVQKEASKLSAANPSQASVLALAGDSINHLESFAGYQRVILFHPLIPDENTLSKLNAIPCLDIVWGDLHQARQRIYWQDYCDRHAHAVFILMEGEGEQLTEWVAATFTAPLPRSEMHDQPEAKPHDAAPLIREASDQKLDSLAYKIISIGEMVKPDQAKENFLIIDCRSELFYQLGHIPNAINMPLDKTSAQSQLDDLRPAFESDNEIVIYSDYANMAELMSLAPQLKQSTSKQIHILQGGWQAWLEGGMPVESDY